VPVREQPVGQVRAEEAGAAGDEDRFAHTPPVAAPEAAKTGSLPAVDL
jgi:hypothetical protein